MSQTQMADIHKLLLRKIGTIPFQDTNELLPYMNSEYTG